MPRPTPKPSKRRPTPTPPTEDVKPLWLVKALIITVLVALLCGYLTLCVLFYQGQWQLVLHPTHAAPSSPAPVSPAPAETIHFGPDETAIPQLTGLWIPAYPGSRYAAITILYLRDGDGSLADSTASLATLHTLGANIFAFDYRGYGQSAATHPAQQTMTQDTATAWQYLITSRSIPARQIVPYGIGTGASLATQLAAIHSDVPAIILDSPRADLLDTVVKDPRSSLVPVRLLFHDRFPLAEPLSTLRTPKLLLSTDAAGQKIPPAFRTAADPKITAEFTTPSDPYYLQTLSRFLDQYLNLPPSTNLQLTPSSPPAQP
jgi:pimeloyl-ACP methyl ester carboxylesterase